MEIQYSYNLLGKGLSNYQKFNYKVFDQVALGKWYDS